MKVYVDKIPQTCDECLFCAYGHNKVYRNFVDRTCGILQIAVEAFESDPSLRKCPLAELPKLNNCK